MTNSSNPIFDLLLGTPNATGQGGPLTADCSKDVAEGILFDDLIQGLLLSENMSAQGEQMLTDGSGNGLMSADGLPGLPVPDTANCAAIGLAASNGESHGEIGQSLATGAGTEGGAQGTLNSLGVGSEGTADLLAMRMASGGKGPDTAVSNNNALLAEDAAIAFNSDLRSLLPSEALVGSLHQITNEIPLDIQSGNYEILRSSVANGTLQLEVVGPEDRSSIIKLSLATSILQEEMSASGVRQGRADRVRLFSDNSGFDRLEHLISRLNLSEIEIKPADTVLPGDASRQPLLVTIKSDGPGRPAIFSGLLDQSSLRATTGDPALTSGNSSDSTDGVKIVAGESRGDKSQPFMVATAATPADNRSLRGRQPTSRPATGGARIGQRPAVLDTGDGLMSVIRSNNAPKQAVARPHQWWNNADPFGKFTMSSGSLDAGVDSGTLEYIAGSGRMATESSLSYEKAETRQVRFSLPDNLPSRLGLNGKTISLKIEPEHLGPARLSLTMYGNKLKAKVMVKTAEAKAMIENSLDILTRQLAKAEIEVDNIEVAIDGDHAEGELPQRRPYWRRSVPNAATDLKALPSDDAAEQLPAYLQSANTYVGAAGVNLLA